MNYSLIDTRDVRLLFMFPQVFEIMDDLFGGEWTVLEASVALFSGTIEM